jgi:hypothetical protein
VRSLESCAVGVATRRVWVYLTDRERSTFIGFTAHRAGQYVADGDIGIGAHVPAHCTAIGKALLGSLLDSELRSLLPSTGLNGAELNIVTAEMSLLERLSKSGRTGSHSATRSTGQVHGRSQCLSLVGLAGRSSLSNSLSPPALTRWRNCLLALGNHKAHRETPLDVDRLVIGPICVKGHARAFPFRDKVAIGGQEWIPY